MDKSACYELGYVEKAHGLSGAVLVKLDVDQPAEYEELESVFLEVNGKLVPFFVDDFYIQGKSKAVILFEDVEDQQAAKNLKGCKLFLPTNLLPELEENQFYFHDIIGFEVIDKTHGNIGKVDSVYDAGHQDLLAVIFNGEEVLIPLIDGIYDSIDKTSKKINVATPEGLLDVYLNPTKEEEKDED